ncbi:MAG: hypothetical protein IPM63_04015 [Acidobacteriota bacterium]|nr:MAG: hypothetical protein IPM63_04015 [Acidobacteriota bacterium]
MFWKFVGVGALVVLAFDTAAALASARFGFSYSFAIVGSILIYSSIGFLAFRQWGLGRALAATILVQIVDSTLGWYISWKIGPGALPPDQAIPSVFVATFVFVIVFAAFFGLVGSALARVIYGPTNPGA